MLRLVRTNPCGEVGKVFDGNRNGEIPHLAHLSYTLGHSLLYLTHWYFRHLPSMYMDYVYLEREMHVRYMMFIGFWYACTYYHTLHVLHLHGVSRTHVFVAFTYKLYKVDDALHEETRTVSDGKKKPTRPVSWSFNTKAQLGFWLCTTFCLVWVVRRMFGFWRGSFCRVSFRSLTSNQINGVLALWESSLISRS